VETCQFDWAGFGANDRATCKDQYLDSDKLGPKLVVVPGIGGGRPFAVTKMEIANTQFNDFCTATGKCRPSSADGKLPATDISFEQAKAYAAWLSDKTGFTYRVPTEKEWEYLATAGGQGSGEEPNCLVMQGDQQIKGGIAIPVTSGRDNPWGLRNVVGNAAEWVETPSGPSLRGGDFKVPLARCTVDWKDVTSGGSDVSGLRLVREMGG
jgi:formylglycine-generating enzyme required for sulfatase activity